MPDIGGLDQLFLTKRRLDADALASPETTRRLGELRTWQADRLAKTYEDLRRDPRCTAAVDFFLTDLYGPQDFTRRDDDFERAWARLKRGLPHAALEVLARALELQVLSAELDRAMIARLAAGAISGLSYANAYRAVGRHDSRRRQIDLVAGIGADLRRLVTFPLLGLALRATHVPAHVAGFGALQDFLERGFQAFRKMGDPSVLLESIQSRETALMRRLFEGNGDPFT